MVEAIFNTPIGVFDSGLGGVSVLRQMRYLMPAEQFLYYGDCANAPYGTRTVDAFLFCSCFSTPSSACKTEIDKQQFHSTIGYRIV